MKGHLLSHLQEEGIVEDDLGRGNAQVQDAVVDCARGLQSAQRLLQVAVERPQLQAAVQPPLHRSLPLRLCRLRARGPTHCQHSHHNTQDFQSLRG